MTAVEGLRKDIEGFMEVLRAQMGGLMDEVTILKKAVGHGPVEMPKIKVPEPKRSLAQGTRRP